MTVLLIAPSNSYRIHAYVNAAQRQGIGILIASQSKYSLVSDVAAGLHISFEEPASSLQRILEAHAKTPFSAVVATDDVAVELAGRVAQALGLPGNDPRSAAITRRKDWARQRLAEFALPVPAFRVLDLNQEFLAQCVGLTFPVVAKPLALSASRGVIRADDMEQLQQACQRIQSIIARALYPAERHQVLIETFIPGPEVAFEGLLHQGELHTIAVFDKPDPLDGPYFQETLYVTPSSHGADCLDRIKRRVAEACKAYGLREGPVHAELRLSQGEAWLLEVAARTIGGECARVLRSGTDVELEDLVLLQALGVEPPSELQEGASGVLMIPFYQAGVLRRVEGVRLARQVPFVDSVEIHIREGYPLQPLPEGSSYLGFVFARATSAGLVETALREAQAHLKVVVAPILPLQVGA